MNQKEITKKSKFLSLVLRHRPQLIGLNLDQYGWTSTENLLLKCQQHGQMINMEMLETIVAENSKKRFSFSEDKSEIRANQGHSIKIDLDLEAVKPPIVLYHGTPSKFVKPITREGLKKRQRHHVHLSADVFTAKDVGARRGLPVIFEIDAQKMHNEGFSFFVSANEVWLTDHVPAKYLSRLQED